MREHVPFDVKLFGEELATLGTRNGARVAVRSTLLQVRFEFHYLHFLSVWFDGILEDSESGRMRLVCFSARIIIIGKQIKILWTSPHDWQIKKLNYSQL